MIERLLGRVLAEQARGNPVVTLVGPRQSGKTTLVRHVFPDHDYVSLERPDRRSAAKQDPVGFLSAHRGEVILDEVQKVPELLSYIQVSVDEDDRPGRFVLTGSQHLLLMQDVSQTLAGRTAVLRLLPLSLAELLDREPIDPMALPDVEPGTTPADPHWKAVFTGFYPRIHDRQLEPTRWLADYHRTYVDRDLRDVLRVMDLDAFERFVRLCAARTATELNLASLADDAGISQPTAKQWLTALRIGSLVTLIQPYHESYRKRLRKRPKLHFLDSGLVCYLLGIEDADTLARHPLRGAIFESYVVAELYKSFEHAGREPRLYHWRDATGHEIDVIIDTGDGCIPVEIKSGQTVNSDTLRGITWWMDLTGKRNGPGVVVHGGTEHQRRSGITVLPWYIR
jgi:predicted AAA+ superfamily ATPase